MAFKQIFLVIILTISINITVTERHIIAEEIISNNSAGIINFETIKNSSIVDILVNTNWRLGYQNPYGIYREVLSFGPDYTYTVYNYGGLIELVTGVFEIKNENEVVLKYPDDILPNPFFSEFEIMQEFAEQIITQLFPEKNDLPLTLDREYADFFIVGRLFSGGAIFTTDIPSPEENEYYLDDAIVIKRNGYLRVLNVLNTRTYPSVNSELAAMRIYDRYSEMNYWFENYYIDQNKNIHLVFPGERFRFIAISRNIDDIDGYSRPWYCIRIEQYHSWRYVWVYGGYIEEIAENDLYNNRFQTELYLINELTERGFLDRRIFDEMGR